MNYTWPISLRLFKNTGPSFELFDPASDQLSTVELRAGVELAVEGLDLVRDAAVWDGFADLTLVVDCGTPAGNGGRASASDTVRLRLAPVLFRHHLHDIETAYVNAVTYQGSVPFRQDMAAALAAAGVVIVGIALAYKGITLGKRAINKA